MGEVKHTPEMAIVGLCARALCKNQGERYGEESTYDSFDEESQNNWHLDVIAVLDTSAHHELVEALELTKRMIDEALPKFDWGKSALDENAIRLLNEAPIAVNAALQESEGVE